MSSLYSLISLMKKLCLLIPVAMVLSLIAADWYVFVVDYGFKHLSSPMTWFMELVFNLDIFLLVTSYVKCISTSSSVRANPPPPLYFELFIQRFPGQTPRVCSKCHGTKPASAHHCSICGECVLKMDHHCPWVANCVGLKNYKFFVLFLFYAVVGCGLYLYVGIPVLFAVMENSSLTGVSAPPFASAMCAIFTGAFGVTLLFFLAFHLTLVVTGRSTIEVRSGAGARPSYRTNWEAVFGKKVSLWFLPMDTGNITGYEIEDTPELQGLLEQGGRSDAPSVASDLV